MPAEHWPHPNGFKFYGPTPKEKWYYVELGEFGLIAWRLTREQAEELTSRLNKTVNAFEQEVLLPQEK